jgi:alpha-tubulin suppressor-like RCC1 family protein
MGAGASTTDLVGNAPLKAEALKFKEEADKNVKNKNYEEAEINLSKSIELEPFSPLLWGLRSAVRYELKYFGQALNDSLTCIALAPTSFFGYYFAGKASSYLGKVHLAHDFFQRAVALNPSAPAIAQAANECKIEAAKTPMGTVNNLISWTNGKDASVLGHCKNNRRRNSSDNISTAGGLYPKMVTGLKAVYVTGVACGMSHNVIISEGGDCYAWGQNKQGQCGLGVSSEEPIIVPSIIPVLIGRKVIGVSCGAGHSIVTTDNCGIWSWGIGKQGQLGHGDEKNKPFPVQIEKLNKYDDKNPDFAVKCGIAHTFIFEKNEKHLFVFGWNTHGQLGKEKKDNEKILEPTQLRHAFSNEITHVSAGGAHSVITTIDGTCYSTGSNSVGQLGLGNLEDVCEFTKIEFVLSKIPIALTACGEEYTIFLSKESAVYGCGLNNAGQAHPSLVENLNVPKHIVQMDGKKITDIICSQSQVFAMNEYGELYTWGLSEERQLENSLMSRAGIVNENATEKDEWAPKQVTALKKKQVLSLQCGRKHFVATIVGTKPNLCYIKHFETKFEYIESGKRIKFKIQAVDTLGNERNMGGDAFLLSLFNENEGEYYFQDSYIDDNLDGSYDGVFKIPRSGIWTIFITCFGEHIQNSPFQVNCDIGRKEQEEINSAKEALLRKEQDKANVLKEKEERQRQIEAERVKIAEEAKLLEEELKRLDEQEKMEREIIAKRDAEKAERLKILTEKERLRKEGEQKKFEEEQRRREEIRLKAELEAEERRLEKERKMKEAEEAHKLRLQAFKEKEQKLLKQKQEEDMKKRKQIMEKLYRAELERRKKAEEIAQRDREKKLQKEKKLMEKKAKRTSGGWVVNFSKGEAWKGSSNSNDGSTRKFGGQI